MQPKHTFFPEPSDTYPVAAALFETIRHEEEGEGVEWKRCYGSDESTGIESH